MASKKSSTAFTLKVVDPTAAIPSVIHGEGRSCTPRGKLGVFMLPRTGKGLLYEFKGGVLHYAELGASQDVPRKIDKPISIANLNAKLEALLNEDVPAEGADAIKGSWTAAVQCDEDKAPMVALKRAIGDRNAIIVQSDTKGENPGWIYYAVRPGRTDAKGNVDEVTSKGQRVGKLRTAIDAAFTDGIKLAASTCARAVTTRKSTTLTKKEQAKAETARRVAQAAPSAYGEARKAAANKEWWAAEKKAAAQARAAQRAADKMAKAEAAAAEKKAKRAANPPKHITARIGKFVRIVAGDSMDMEGKVLKAEPGIENSKWLLHVKTPEGVKRVLHTSVRGIAGPKATVAKPPRKATATAQPKVQAAAAPKVKPFDATAELAAKLAGDPLAGLL